MKEQSLLEIQRQCEEITSKLEDLIGEFAELGDVDVFLLMSLAYNISLERGPEVVRSAVEQALAVAGTVEEDGSHLPSGAYH